MNERDLNCLIRLPRTIHSGEERESILCIIWRENSKGSRRFEMCYEHLQLFLEENDDTEIDIFVLINSP
jgi:hypothetical protein